MAARESDRVEAYLSGMQGTIVDGLSRRDAAAFVTRPWESALGSGTGMLLEGGETFERAGVSVSRVASGCLPPAATERNPELRGKPYVATGLSLVIHPRNPFVPTAHMNVRFFTTVGDEPRWWFGGGMDLTPHYGFEEDCAHFHQTCRRALDGIDPGLYPAFKKRCDEYFHIRHRNQMRGVGGVFFDDYSEGGVDASSKVMEAVAEAFLPAYLPIVDRRRDTPYDDRNRAHQLHRRGRYAEFNLVQDRGTLFGLQSGGKADAILMSMPPLAGWDVTGVERDLADEEKLAGQFLVPRDWASWEGQGTDSSG